MDKIKVINAEEEKLMEMEMEKQQEELTKMPAAVITSVEAIKRTEALSGSVSPRLKRTLTKPPSGRWNCLCSPTTHAGSFRCRFHRIHGNGMLRGGSIGSNLSELAAQSRTIRDLA